MARTAEQKYLDMALRDRTRDQIRAVAVARDDKDLLEYLQQMDSGPTVLEVFS